jgi:hypothetical protein
MKFSHPTGILSCLILPLTFNSQIHGQNAFLFQEGRNGHTGCRDVHIFADKPGWNTGNEPLLETTGNGGLSDAKHTLIRFDLSSIPSSTRIDSASFSLYFDARRTQQTGDKTLSIYKLNRPWAEGTGNDPGGLDGRPAIPGETNWQYAMFDSQAWAVPGANGIPIDRSGLPVDSVVLTSIQDVQTWHNWNITELCQFWISHPDSNFGMVVRETNVSSARGILDFASSENPDPIIRHLLFVQAGTANQTIVRSTSETHSTNIIRVTARILGDENQNGTATISHRESGSMNWSIENRMEKSRTHYSADLQNLLANTAYDVRVTFADPDGVQGENPNILSNILTGSDSEGGFINLAHLNHLTETVLIEGDSMAIVHIYSSFPDYAWVGDSDEGIAAVDDAARAVVAYLMHFRHTNSQNSLRKARLLLRFLFRMQAGDGGFYNFIWPDFSINTNGSTSNNNGFNFWASRALWAMGFAYNTFAKKEIEPDLRTELDTRISTAINKADSYTWNAYSYDTLHGFQIPAYSWLLNNGSDQSSEAALGLAYYYEITQDPNAGDLLTKLCDGMAAFQLGDALDYPFAVHLSFVPNIHLWHGWGSRQSQALALAGKIMNREDWIQSAMAEAENFYLHLLTSQQIHELRPGPIIFPQINYDVSPIVGGLMQIFRATGEQKYAKYAGLFAAWWMGDNPLSFAMYDSTTGRSFDGLEANGVNLNSGAESVAECLIAVQDVYHTTEARPFLYYSRVADNRYLFIEAENYSEIVTGPPQTISAQNLGNAQFSNSRYLQLTSRDRVRYQFSVADPFPWSGDFQLYAQFVHQTGAADETAIDVSFDNGQVFSSLQGGFPSQFLWVDRAGPPIYLGPGAHTMEVSFSGTNSNKSAKVDYFLLQPLNQRKVFANPAGDTLSIDRVIPIVVGIDEDDSDHRPAATVLMGNYPNPFNRQTTVSFALKKDSFITLKIFDLLGKEVETLVNQDLAAGLHRVGWDAGPYPSGVYFCKLKAGSRIFRQKMIYLK